jgi:hypothetical protein
LRLSRQNGQDWDLDLLQQYLDTLRTIEVLY